MTTTTPSSMTTRPRTVFEQHRQLQRLLKCAKRVYWTIDGVTHRLGESLLSSRSQFAWDTFCNLQADKAKVMELSFDDGKTSCLGCLANEEHYDDLNAVLRRTSP